MALIGVHKMHGRVHPNSDVICLPMTPFQYFIIRLPYHHLHSSRSQLIAHKHIGTCSNFLTIVRVITVELASAHPNKVGGLLRSPPAAPNLSIT